MPVVVSTVYRDDVEVAAARGGENLRLRLTGVDEDEVAGGFVLCSRSKPVPCVTYFDVQLQARPHRALGWGGCFNSFGAGWGRVW